MSLRDTFKGAQQEARDAADGRAKTAKEDDAQSGEKNEGAKYTRSYKSSAATARPSREAASSVRVAKSTTHHAAASKDSKVDKETRKKERAKERDIESFRQRGYEVLLKHNERYKQTERTWWILIGIGFGLTILTLLLAWLYPDQGSDVSTAIGITAVVALVGAYGFIIGGFVYDWVVRRPYRKEAERRIASFSDKKIADILEKDRREVQKELAEKQAKKAAKKGREAK